MLASGDRAPPRIYTRDLAGRGAGDPEPRLGLHAVPSKERDGPLLLSGCTRPLREA